MESKFVASLFLSQLNELQSLHSISHAVDCTGRDPETSEPAIVLVHQWSMMGGKVESPFEGCGDPREITFLF